MVHGQGAGKGDMVKSWMRDGQNLSRRVNAWTLTDIELAANGTGGEPL